MRVHIVYCRRTVGPVPRQAPRTCPRCACALKLLSTLTALFGSASVYAWPLEFYSTFGQCPCVNTVPIRFFGTKLPLNNKTLLSLQTLMSRESDLIAIVVVFALIL